MIRFLTAGESHGPGLTTVIEGIPAGLKLDLAAINLELRRRQMGYGRGKRMRIESDRALITGGLWEGETIGSPIAIHIPNKDHKNWKDRKREPKSIPRPGHADLAGYLKYDYDDLQKVIERASARETAARTAAGAVAKQYLAQFGIVAYSHTRQIGGVVNETPVKFTPAKFREIEKSKVRCADAALAKRMIAEIDKAVERKDTLGGVSEIVVLGVPIGLGSYAQWDRRADARLAFALMSIQSVKAVEIGAGISAASSFGSEVHDPVSFKQRRGFTHESNNAGGILGGITNGEEIVLRAFFKPISTLGEPLQSTDLKSKKRVQAPYVRSDICVVPAGGVVAEAMTALVLADLVSEKFGGDSIREAVNNFRSYGRHLKSR
ncbi:MAG: chorismate synthase [bacterium]